MCAIGSVYQTEKKDLNVSINGKTTNIIGAMCNELGIGQRRLYSDATGLGRSGSHKEQQTHSGDGIS